MKRSKFSEKQVREVFQHPAASGQFDRAVNPADGVGSLKQGHEHIRPTRKVAWCITVPNGTAKMEIPD